MTPFSAFLAASINRPDLVGHAARLLADAGRLDCPEDALVYVARHRRVDALTLAAVEAAERVYRAR